MKLFIIKYKDQEECFVLSSMVGFNYSPTTSMLTLCFNTGEFYSVLVEGDEYESFVGFFSHGLDVFYLYRTNQNIGQVCESLNET